MARIHRRHPFSIAVAVALWSLLLGGRLHAEYAGGRVPLCREDGVRLPGPRLASEVVAELRPEAPQGSEPATPCGAPLLVKREAHVTPRDFQRLLQDRGYAQIEGLLTPQWWRVCLPESGPSAQSAELATLLALPEVEFAEPDGIAYAAWTPNDPYYPDLGQWGLPKVGAPGAWDTTLGSSEVVIAVVDSGVDYTHLDSPEFLELGYDCAYDDSDPFDDYGHGTHVTGIAAARTNNDVGMAGLCPGCSVLAIKVLNSGGSGFWSDVADGITYAADTASLITPRLIINLSLGGSASAWEQVIVSDAIAYARAGGALVVAAAGNYGPAAPMFPASLQGVLAVSATDSLDIPSSPPTSVFVTQYGDIAAPGSSIYSSVPLWKRNPPYDYMSGTSMATPLVAAAAGLVWSVHPEYSSFQVKLALLKNVDVPSGWDPLYGVGRLNVERAVTAPEIVLQHVYLPLTVR